MAGPIHQGLVRVFESRPQAVRALLRGRIRLPRGELRPTSTDVTELSIAERHADVMLEVGGPPPSAGVIVEPQLYVDDSKRYSWPQYVAGGRARLRCPIFLVVVTLDEAVARWARRPITLGPGSVVRPIVIGPTQLRPIRDLATARRQPELAWMGTLAHAAEPGGDQIAFAAMEALGHLPDELAQICADILMASVPEDVRTALEDPMATGNYEYQSEFAKRYVAQGRAEGAARAVTALQHVLLAQLAHRRFHVSDAVRERVEATEDVAQLEQWSLRVLGAKQLEDVFG